MKLIILKREHFPAGSGMNPDMMAHILLKGGPGLTMEQAKEIFNTEYTYVKAHGW